MKRLLLVEDDPLLRRLFSRKLKGMEVVEAASVESAKALLQAESFDNVLSDVMLGESTGADLHRWLTQSQPDLAARMVFMTGGVYDTMTAAYIKAGGRVLFTFGCAPPREVLTGSFASPGPGSDWFVTDNRHALTQGLQVGELVRYKAYRYSVSGLGQNARVLLREADGSPAVTAVSRGQGEMIQTCGDLGATDVKRGPKVVLSPSWARRRAM